MYMFDISHKTAILFNFFSVFSMSNSDFRIFPYFHIFPVFMLQISISIPHFHISSVFPQLVPDFRILSGKSVQILPSAFFPYSKCGKNLESKMQIYFPHFSAFPYLPDFIRKSCPNTPVRIFSIGKNLEI